LGAIPEDHLAWIVNRGWVLAANIATDLTAWTRLLGLHDQPELAHAEPATLRYRLLHLPAKLATHARRRVLSIPDTWPWAQAFTSCWHHLSLLPEPT
jgi:Transposase DDE domain group 1